jgi:nitroreductase
MDNDYVKNIRGDSFPNHFLIATLKGGVEKHHKTKYGDYMFNYGLVGMAAQFYKLILKATELELNSCFTGIFRESTFKKAMGLSDEYRIPLLSPIGYSPQEMTKGERYVYNKHKSGERKKFGEVFLNMAGEPFEERDAGDYLEALEVVRKGPSAGNHQSWRFYIEPDLKSFHLYVRLEPKKKSYREKHLNEMDAGIAMVNFGFIAKQSGLKGTWKIQRPDISVPDAFLYVGSYISSK